MQPSHSGKECRLGLCAYQSQASIERPHNSVPGESLYSPGGHDLHVRVDESKNIPAPQELTQDSETLAGSNTVESAEGQLAELTRVGLAVKPDRSGDVI